MLLLGPLEPEKEQISDYLVECKGQIEHLINADKHLSTKTFLLDFDRPDVSCYLGSILVHDYVKIVIVVIA